MKSESVQAIEQDLDRVADPVRAQHSQRFFKTGKGEYGEGDIFLGVKVPDQRIIARRYRDLALPEIKNLLNSKIHEHRLTALFILVAQYKRAQTEGSRHTLATFYLKHRAGVNNWDLVDSSAPYILGEYFLARDRQPIYELVQSENMWDRRIAVLTTFWFIKEGDFKDSFRFAEALLSERQVLIQKAVGWMLREVGNRDQNAERLWLDRYYEKMPRTMLRYAIERFPQTVRKRYMQRDTLK